MIALLLAIVAAGPESCGGSQRELNACVANSFKQADKELNAQWAKTLSTLRRHDKDMSKWPSYLGASADTLLQAQRAWLSYREKSCQTSARISAGTIAPMNYYFCMYSMTRARTAELRAIALNPNSGEPL